jgi:hypothetical protein
MRRSIGRPSLLYLLLCAPVALTLYAIATELSFVVPGLRPQRELQATGVVGPFQDGDALRSPLYPTEVFDVDWSQRIAPEEFVHEAALHRGCVAHKDSVIPWTFGRPGQNESEERNELVNRDDPQLLEKLRHCPDVDVLIPSGLRGFGYCEDAAAYTKCKCCHWTRWLKRPTNVLLAAVLESRMLPNWVLEVKFRDEARNRSVSYHDLCPHTPMIFFNHYWEGLVDNADWPATKPLYLMPNPEMYELESKQYWRADVVLCKTAVCARYLRKWFKQEGNPRGTKVLYTRHTTSNLALTRRSQLGASEDDTLSSKNFSYVKFLHTAGTSIQKGTRPVLDCWLSRVVTA